MDISRHLMLANGSRRDALKSCAVGLAAAALPSFSHAQLGAKPARIIVGFGPGGAGDPQARSLAEDLKRLYPSGIIVDNRPGASGRIAVSAVANSEPDGNTLLLAPSATLAIIPHTVKPGSFQPLQTLVPIVAVAKQDYAIVVPASAPFKRIGDMLAAAKAQPQYDSYGTAGNGTPQHLIGHLLSTASGVTLRHVPYRGGAVAMQDVVGGQVPMGILAISRSLLTLVNEGRLRILAIAGSQRVSWLPQVPTLQEEGYKDIAVDDWSGLLAPARTPASVVEQIARETMKVTSSSAYSSSLAMMGQEPLSVGSSQYAARLRSESDRWSPVIRAAGFTIDS